MGHNLFHPAMKSQRPIPQDNGIAATIGKRFGKSSNSRVDRFQKTLMEYGFTVIVRKTRGDDIDAACGQLAGDVIDRTKRTAMKRKFGEGIDVKAVN